MAASCVVAVAKPPLAHALTANASIKLAHAVLLCPVGVARYRR